MYRDSSHGNAKDVKSILGYVLFLYKNVITFKTKNESIVTSHLTEAEYVTLSEAIKKLKEAAIRQVKNSTFFTKNRHVDIRLALNRQELSSTKATLSYVTTDENLADALTKIYGRKV
eukprot:snap_masked-scaffold_26-processed-gene-3.46-mRNA-1 protein AED:1.00 eAED:1.00 QI:0/0/0/0/1/1/2/0/116